MITTQTIDILIRAKDVLQKKTGTDAKLSAKKKLLVFITGLFSFLQNFKLIKTNAEVLFLTSNHYEAEENGLLYDKFISPFTNYLDKNRKTYKIARFSNRLFLPKNYYNKQLIALQNIGLFYSKVFPLYPEKTTISEVSHRMNIDEAIINTYVKNFLTLKSLYKRYLKRTGTKYVVLVCYYDLKSYAMLQAANELGIKSIDLQHGVQGEGHFAYNRTNYMYDVQTKLYPTYFWCWDNYSANVIRTWFSHPEHVIEGGNQWMMNRIKPMTKKYITFTMQPLDNSLPKILLDAIKQYKGSYIWCIRLHPHQLSQKVVFLKILEDYGIKDKVFFDGAENIPLNALLNETLIHITRYSSVVLEAYWYGIPSIVLERKGLQYFRENIPHTFLIYILTTNELLHKIEELKNCKNKRFTFADKNKKNFDQLANIFFNYE